MIFDTALIIDSIPKMLVGIGLTFQLLFLSLALGTVLAIVLLLLRISGRWYLAAPTMIYIYIFRGTPILVQIFIIYYGLPQLEFIRDSIFWPILREPFGCAIVALSLNTGAYVSEIFRGGVLGVDRGLTEAGAALGLSVTHRFIYITTPIAIRLSVMDKFDLVVSSARHSDGLSTRHCPCEGRYRHRCRRICAHLSGG